MKKSLHEMTPEELGKLFPIKVVDYNPEWPELFRLKRDEIENLLGADLIRIEHFGSTAVPGLVAKPTIDILVAIPEGKEAEERVKTKMQSAGYECIRRTDCPPPYWMFVDGYTPTGFVGQCYHLHVAPESHRGLWERIDFRDYLIRHPEVAGAYGDLKKSLAVRHRNNREDYTAAKADFVAKYTAIARAEANSQ